jgi:hypothetical protein
VRRLSSEREDEQTSAAEAGRSPVFIGQTIATCCRACRLMRRPRRR